MKIGKLHKSGLIKVLLGLAVAGALLFAACQNIFDMAETKSQDDGYGYVKVDLDLGDARTLRPELSQITKYTYKFTGVDVSNVVDITYDNTTPNPEAFRLPEGNYTLSVEAYTGSGPYNLAATGVYSGGNPPGQFPIVVNQPTNISVVLTPKVTNPGNLTISIKLPANNPNASTGDNTTVVLADGNVGFTYEIKQLLAAGAIAVPTPGISLTRINSTSPATPGNAGGFVTYSLHTTVVGNSVSTPSGTYLITGRINTNNAKYGGFSEVIHVYENMLTVFDKDYTVTDTLASVTTANEAFAILTDEITAWIKIPTSGVNSGKNPLTASGGKDLTTAGTIRLNYVKSRTDLIGTPGVSGSPAVNFPIVLQGGWILDPNVDNNSWNVGDSSAVTTVNLINTSVKTNGNLAAAPTYIVELWPVAEYNLEFGGTVDAGDRAGRSVTVTDVGGTGSKGPIVLNADTPNGKTSGIGLVGNTDITIVTAAITISIDGAKASFAQPDNAGVYKLTPAESRTYDIKVYQTVEQQASAAFDRLRSEIASVWVEQKAALTRSEGPAFTASTNTNFPAYYGGSDTVTLSYVVRRLDATTAQAVAGNTFYIDVPNSVASPNPDDRWEVSGLWTTTVGAGTVTDATSAAAANVGDSKTIYYRPYGGDRIPFYVKWVPVAEFYVSYVERDVPVVTPPVYPTTSNVIIKDDASSGGTNVSYKLDDNTGPFGDYDTYKGKKYKLGSTNIATSDVTIQMDFITRVPDGTSTTTGAWDYVLETGPQTAAPALTDIQKILQTFSAGINVIVTSREYHVRVYRTIAKQISDAQAEIKAETDVLKWFNDTNDYTTNPSSPTINTIYHPDGLKATTTAADLQSNMTFVGAEPTFKFRNDYVAPTYDSDGNLLTPESGSNFGNSGLKAKGWSGYVTAQGSVTGDATHGSKTLQLKFTPKGAIEVATSTGPAYSATDGVYRIKLQPALLYRVNYQKFPIGNDKVTGTVTVVGAEPGGTTAITPARPAYSDSSTDPEFIGVGSAITVTATSTPADKINVLKNRGDSSAATNTSTAAGVLTIAAPANYAAMTAAANVTPINIDVYPSIADQQGNFLSNMRKVSRTSLIDWTGSPTPSLALAASINDNLPRLTTDVDTAFQIVANPIPTISKPGNDYYLEAANATSVGYAALSIDNTTPANADTWGNKSVPIKFTPNGTLAPLGADERTYTFKLTAVAQYNIVMMHGPTGASSYNVDLQINTYLPGTDGTGTAASGGTPANPKGHDNLIPWTQGEPKTTYYGGIGTFPATAGDNRGPPQIKADGGNIFSTDFAATGTFVLNSGNTLTQSTAITSKIYTIRVYPTLADQTAMVRTKLNNLAGTSASGWVTNKATATVGNTIGTRGANLIGPVGSDPTVPGPGNFRAGTVAGDTDTLEFQYWGDDPTIVPPTSGSPASSTIITPNDTNPANADGYTTYALATGTVGSPNGTTGVREIGITFTPFGGSPVTNFFTIRTIPLVKYNVNYANGASGTVSIRLPNVVTPTAEDIVLFNAVGANPATQTGYIRRGSTTIGISTTKGSYNEIQVRQLTQITGAIVAGTYKSKTEPAGGGANDFTAANYPADNEWEILVIQ